MKEKKYTRKQIEEAIRYWQNQLKILVESKSPLLNAIEKHFNNNDIYSYDYRFNWTYDNVMKLFNILDKVVFNGKLNKITTLNVHIGNPVELNSIIRKEYVKNANFDISPYIAIYQPKIKYSINSVTKRLIITKSNDAIFINLDKNSTSTFAYAIVVLCHEMIHCLDANEGTLIKQTEDLLNKHANPEVIDYLSHSTNLFKKKATIMKTQHGITVIENGNSEDFATLNKKATDEIQILKEVLDEDGNKKYELTKQFKNKYKGFAYFNTDGTGSLIFGQ